MHTQPCHFQNSDSFRTQGISKMLSFWKKGPDCVHHWVKYSIQNVNVWLCSFVLLLLTKCISKCPSSMKLASGVFKIERITIFVFSFFIGLVTQLTNPALGVLKHHYIIKRIRELLIGDSRFLIYNLLNQLLYYTV